MVVDRYDGDSMVGSPDASSGIPLAAPPARSVEAKRCLLSSTALTAVVMLAGVVTSTGGAWAATLYWDGTPVVANNQPDGGSGTWNSSATANWTVAPNSDADVAWTNGSDAVFGGASGTVTVNDVSAGNVTVNSMTFTTTGYTIGGSALTLVGTDTTEPLFDNTIINVGTGLTATISASLQGTASGIEKTGSGTLILSGDNSGIIGQGDRISAGTLQVDNDNALGDPNTGVDVAGPTSVLDLTGNSVGVNAVIVQSGGTIQGGTITVGFDGTAAIQLGGGTISSDIAGGAANTGVTVAVGTSVFSGANSYDGATVIDSGAILNIRSATALGSTTTGTTVDSGGTLQLQNSIDIGNEALSLSGTGVGGTQGALENVSGTNEVDGPVTLAGDTLINSDAGDLVIFGAVSGAHNLTLGGAGNGGLESTVNIGANTLTKNGGGVWGIIDATTVGSVVVNAGALQVNTGGGTANAVLPDTVAVTINNSGIVSFEADETIGSVAGGANTTISINNGKTLTTGGNDNSTSFDGTIKDFAGHGNLVKAGTGTFTLTGTNSYSGTTTVSGGTLNANSSNALGDGSATNTLIFNGGTLQAAGAITSPSTRGVTMTGAGTIDSNGHPVTIAGQITGAGALTVADTSTLHTGALVLTGTNTGTGYSGTATVTTGTLQVDGVFGDVSSAHTAKVVLAGGTLKGTGTIDADVSATSASTLSPGDSPGTLTIGGNLNLTSMTTNFELNTAGQVDGTGGTGNDLVVVGGNLTLGGTLNIGPTGTVPGQLGSGDYRLFNVTTGTITGSFSSVVAGGSSTATVYEIADGAGGNADQVNVTVSNGGQIVQYWDGGDTLGQTGNSGSGTADGGAGNWTATNTNWTEPAYGVNETWHSQMGIFGPASSGSAPFAVALTGTQNFQRLQFTADGYVLSGGALGLLADTPNGNSTQSTIITNSGVTATINSPIQGTAIGLDKEGAGTLVLGGTNTYTGDTTVSAGTLTLTGSITSNTTNNSTLNLNAGGSITGTLNNNVALNVNGGGTSTVTGLLTNAGTAVVAAGATLTDAAGITNTSTGHITNNGTVNDALNNAGVTDNNATYNANVATNTGTINNNATGTWNGNVLSNAGTINNTGVWNGNFTTSGIVNAQNQLSGSVNNSGQFNVTGVLTGITALTNSNALNLGNSSLTVGSLANTGTVNMVNNVPNQTLTTAQLTGNGTANLDIDLSGGNAAQRADKIVVTNPAGFAAGNSETINFNYVSPVRVLTPDIEIIQGSNGGNATAANLPGPGIINYSLIRSGNDWVVHATANPVLGGIASNISLVESTIGSVVNRPSSPFVSGLAADVEPGHCGAGPWVRGTGGIASATGTATADGATSSSKVDLNYKGAQFGLDIACFNIKSTGIDVAVGVIGGLNNGATTQDLSSVGGGMTDSSFDQKYAGLYATIAKGAFSADIQARYDTTDFTFNNATLGLTNSGLNSQRYTISGSASYAIDLKGASFVPAVGFSGSRTTSSTIVSALGGSLTPDASLSLVGFVGATLAKTIILPDQKSAVTPFVTATLYNDFAANPTSTFIDTLGNTEIITSQNLGMVGEGSVGLNYVKILDSTPTGPKQINASVRADLKYSDRVTGAGLTAQARVQF